MEIPEQLVALLTWQNAAGAVGVYYVARTCYRLFLHPLARFPGPKLAAATRWYEGYYDVVLNGQYTFKIGELHRKYGPIVRISPDELHINDPAFFNQLYRYEGRWDKYDWAYGAFGAPYSTICCIDHDLHKQRRAPIERYLSKANVIKNQHIIRHTTAVLCDRLAEFEGTGKSVNLGTALSAYVRDVAGEWLHGKQWNNLQAEDFNAGMTAIFQSAGKIWRITKHFRWFGPLMKSIPPAVINAVGDQGSKDFFGFLAEMLETTEQGLSSMDPSKQSDTKEYPTIVHAIASSTLPPSEKTATRISDDTMTVTGAAFETTAAALRVILYYLYSDPQVLVKLRAEINEAVREHGESELGLAILEKLPYLTAVLTEGLRLAPGIATRQARVAPDRDLLFEEWRIPAGTPVGMTVLLLHMDERVYSDPERFAPERWLEPSAARRKDRTFAPFSKGSRICAGMHLGWAEMYYVVSVLVQTFDFKFDGAGPKDVKPYSDQIVIGTKDSSGIKAFVSRHHPDMPSTKKTEAS
ncbi:cytochrome P450 [Thozetella sp. PMI_491]|nr:cytochrome P450 [Thozetella sp. PMI_491]